MEAALVQRTSLQDKIQVELDKLGARNITPEIEREMQERLNRERKQYFQQSRVYRDDIQEEIASLGRNMTPEKEKELQAIIDEREAKLRERELGAEVVLEENIEEMEKEKEILEAEIVDEKYKCELCKSKGFRHKKDCPTLK